MAHDREIEATFELTPCALDSLRAIRRAGRFVVTGRDAFEQDDLYYDTRQRGLAAAGATLRVRFVADQARMTFKGPRTSADSAVSVHIANRQEVEVSLTDAFADGLSDSQPLPDDPDLAPLTHARELAGAGQFLPVARVQNHRMTLQLKAPDGTALELALDDCEGTRISDHRVVAFIEAELELKAGDPDAVTEVGENLREAAPDLMPSEYTKLGRILG
jgi:inorganic triphosphatase YgiF